MSFIQKSLHLAVILRNSANNKFIKFVEQQLKIINYSELVPDFSFAINLQCYIHNRINSYTSNTSIMHISFGTSLLKKFVFITPWNSLTFVLKYLYS